MDKVISWLARLWYKNMHCLPPLVLVAIKKITDKIFFGERSRKKVLRYFKAHPDEAKKYTREIEFLEKNREYQYIPYDWVKQFKQDVVSSVNTGISDGTEYIVHNGKKLFFYTDAKITYTNLIMEQQTNSPHLYFTSDILAELNNGGFDRFIDIGCAEAIMALEVVDKVNELVLVEFDTKWSIPLQKTFLPYMEKTIIIKKLMSDTIVGEYTTLDEITKGLDLSKTLVKMDVEGFEDSVLRGAVNCLKSVKCWCVCTYHNQSDYDEFSRLFKTYGYDVTHSDGWMLVYHEKPYFRHGVLRALRQE